MAEISPDLEQQLANMSDAEFSALSAKVRAPDSREALRTAASSLISDDSLESFVKFADVSKFTDSSGAIDQAKVNSHLGALFGTPQSAAGQAAWGQHSGGNAPGLNPGDRGRLAAAKRFGTPVADETTAAAGRVADGKGEAGRAAAAKRFPPPPQQESK
jgi:hypothetical protein